MTSTLVRRVSEAIRQYGLFSRGDAVVVGVSGGPDSLGLLLALSRLGASEDLDLRLTVAHVDHGMRPSAKKEAEFVRQFAAGLALECRIGRYDVPALAKREPSVEAVARRCRYEFFEKVAGEVGAASIALGHNADDQVETILMHIMRGTGLTGLEGMQRVRPLHSNSVIRVVRPLLGIRRRDIEAFLTAEGVAWCVDETNLGDDYVRSRVRNELLPLLRSRYNANVGSALLNLSELAAQANELVQELAEEAQSGLVRLEAERVLLDAEAVARLHPTVRGALLRRVLKRFKPPGSEIGLVHVRQLEDILESEGSSKTVPLPGGVLARKEYDELVLTSADAEPPPASSTDYPLAVPGVTLAVELAVAVHAFAQDFYPERFKAFKETKNALQEIVAQDKLPPGLVVRSRRSGDVFQPLGAPGHKKLNEYFTDQKVPVAKRDMVPLVAAGNEIIWVIGQRLGELARIDESTRKVVVLTASRMHLGASFKRP